MCIVCNSRPRVFNIKLLINTKWFRKKLGFPLIMLILISGKLQIKLCIYFQLSTYLWIADCKFNFECFINRFVQYCISFINFTKYTYSCGISSVSTKAYSELVFFSNKRIFIVECSIKIKSISYNTYYKWYLAYANTHISEIKQMAFMKINLIAILSPFCCLMLKICFY